MRWWRPRKRQVTSIDPNEQPAPLDRELIDVLRSRDGLTTTVLLEDGRRLQVLDIAWGYDWQDQYAHVTTNCSPGAPGLSLDSFFTNAVVSIVADDDGVLYRR